MAELRPHQHQRPFRLGKLGERLFGGGYLEQLRLRGERRGRWPK
jgi:hypothetical protein